MGITRFLRMLFYPLGIRFGYCNSCQKKTIFSYQLIKKYRIAKQLAYAESGFCIFCSSSIRNRALISQLDFEDKSSYCFMTSSSGPVYHYIKNNFHNSIFSQYKLTKKIKRDVLIEDLQNLSFNDCEFDIIISEHDLEHVADIEKCFNEIYRALKPNGKFIFTIPFESNHESINRIEKNLKEKFHGDPLNNNGALVIHDFSEKDFLSKFGLIFENREFRKKHININNVKVDTMVFVFSKRGNFA